MDTEKEPEVKAVLEKLDNNARKAKLFGGTLGLFSVLTVIIATMVIFVALPDAMRNVSVNTNSTNVNANRSNDNTTTANTNSSKANNNKNNGNTTTVNTNTSNSNDVVALKKEIEAQTETVNTLTTENEQLKGTILNLKEIQDSNLSPEEKSLKLTQILKNTKIDKSRLDSSATTTPQNKNTSINAKIAVRPSPVNPKTVPPQ